MYWQALESEIPPEKFWGYSPLEVYDLMQSHYNVVRQKTRQEIMRCFVQAEATTRYVCNDGKQEVPHPWEYYPELFAEEERWYKETQEKNRLEEYKEARKAYAEEFNRRRQNQ